MIRVDFSVDSRFQRDEKLPNRIEQTKIRSGMVLLRPLQDWVLDSFELRGPDRNDLDFLISGNIEYDINKSGVLQPSRYVTRQFTFPPGGERFASLERQTEFKALMFSFDGEPEDQFTVQAFGLAPIVDEKNKVRPFSIIYWIMGAALVLSISSYIIWNKYKRISV